jgi:hypothetical protein
MPAPKFLPVPPRMTTTPPVMYSSPWSPTPSTTALAPGGGREGEVRAGGKGGGVAAAPLKGGGRGRWGVRLMMERAEGASSSRPAEARPRPPAPMRPCHDRPSGPRSAASRPPGRAPLLRTQKRSAAMPRK